MEVGRGLNKTGRYVSTNPNGSVNCQLEIGGREMDSKERKEEIELAPKQPPNQSQSGDQEIKAGFSTQSGRDGDRPPTKTGYPVKAQS